MKVLIRMLIGALALTMIALPALAGPPAPGVYKSATSQIMQGRYTESGTDVGNWDSYFTTGNAMNAESYDSMTTTLAGQWTISCPHIVSALKYQNLPGWDKWIVTYQGGTFTLQGTGTAWDGGDATYFGVVQTHSQTVTVLKPSGARDANISFSGYFTGPGYPCFTLIANGAEVSGLSGPFPPFVDQTCGVAAGGSTWLLRDITLTITNCSVPVQDGTWGKIKSLYQ
jgi:hypothetical protein